MLDYGKRAVRCSTKGGKTYMVRVMEHSHYESAKGREEQITGTGCEEPWGGMPLHRSVNILLKK